MTDLTRRLIRQVSRLAGPGDQRPHSDGPRQIHLVAPGQILAHADDVIVEALRGAVERLQGDLTQRDQPTVTVSPSSPRNSDLELSIDGRPIIVLREDHDEMPTTAADLARTATRFLLRRLPLLLGPSEHDRPAASYLLAVGCTAPSDADETTGGIEHAERLMDKRISDEIVVEVPSAILRRVDGEGQRAVADLRERVFREQGLLYPDVRIEVTDEDDVTVRFRFNDVTMPALQLGADATWTDVVHRLGEELAARRNWFLRVRDVGRVIRDDLAFFYPDLVGAALANYPEPVLTACLREMARNGDRIANIPRILWLLLEGGRASTSGPDELRLSESLLLPKARHRPSAESDPIRLASGLRKIASEEAWRLGSYRPPEDAVRLPPALEKQLLSAMSADDRGVAEWAIVRAVTVSTNAREVITHTVDAIGPVRDALQSLPRPPRVIASQELPPDADLAGFPIVGASTARTEPQVHGAS